MMDDAVTYKSDFLAVCRRVDATYDHCTVNIHSIYCFSQSSTNRFSGVSMCSVVFQSIEDVIIFMRNVLLM